MTARGSRATGAGPVAAVALLALALGGCALFRSDAEALREEVVETALDQVGEDYEYGGADPWDGFDCSGLVHYSYREAGIELPRATAGQRRAGRHVNFSDARPADLLFYNFADVRGKSGRRPPLRLHVALYLGDGRAVHAPVTDGEVEIIDVTKPYWRQRYLGARRIIQED